MERSVKSRRTEQIIGREGETANLFGRCPLNFTLSLAVSPHVISTVRRFVFEMMKRPLLNLLIVGCVQLSLVLACDSEHPSDAELEKNFYEHETDLNLLAQMAIEDADMIRIAPGFTWHKDNADGRASKAKYGFSDERYEKYKQLFRRLGRNDGILNYQPEQMLVLMSSRGMVTGGSSKGYAYLLKEPSSLLDSLDNVSFKNSEKHTDIAYKHLKGNWYLFYEVS